MYHGNYRIRARLFTRALSQNPSFYNDIYRMFTWDRKRNLPEMKFRFAMKIAVYIFFFIEGKTKWNFVLGVVGVKRPIKYKNELMWINLLEAPMQAFIKYVVDLWLSHIRWYLFYPKVLFQKCCLWFFI